MNIYLSGAITARTKRKEQKNRARFYEKAAELRSLGHSVYNPCEGALEQAYVQGNASYEEILAYDIFKVMECEAIFLMKSWQNSHGAKLEKAVAENLNKKIMYEA